MICSVVTPSIILCPNHARSAPTSANHTRLVGREEKYSNGRRLASGELAAAPVSSSEGNNNDSKQQGTPRARLRMADAEYICEMCMSSRQAVVG